jgi:hypothetical protein
LAFLLGEADRAVALRTMVKVFRMDELDALVLARRLRVENALARRGPFDIEGVPFDEALRTIADAARANVVIDPRIAKSALKFSKADPKGVARDEKSATRALVTYRAEEAAAGEALEAIVKQAGLAYEIRDEAVFVTKPEYTRPVDQCNPDYFHKARLRAFEELCKFAGDYVRDNLLEQAQVEPSETLRGKIISGLRKLWPDDPVVREKLRWQDTPEAREARDMRREQIQDERLRRLKGQPVAPRIDETKLRLDGNVF